MKFMLLLLSSALFYTISSSSSSSFSISSDSSEDYDALTSFETTLIDDYISTLSESYSSDSDSNDDGIYIVNAAAVAGIVDGGSSDSSSSFSISSDSSEDYDLTSFETTLMDDYASTLSESYSSDSDSDSNDDGIPITFAAAAVAGVIDGESSSSSLSLSESSEDYDDLTSFETTLMDDYITTLSESYSYSSDSDSNDDGIPITFGAAAVAGVVDDSSSDSESSDSESYDAMTSFETTLMDGYVSTLSESYSSDSDSDSNDDGIPITFAAAAVAGSSDSESSEDYDDLTSFESTLMDDYITTLSESYSSDSVSSDSDSSDTNVVKSAVLKRLRPRAVAASVDSDQSVDEPEVTELDDDDDDDLLDTETDSDDVEEVVSESIDSDTSTEDASTDDEGLIASLFGRSSNSHLSGSKTVIDGEEDVDISLSTNTLFNLWMMVAGFAAVNVLICVSYYVFRKKTQNDVSFDETNNV